MTYTFTPRWDLPHRVRWTEDGGFCDAGEDCPVCGAEQDDYEEDEGYKECPRCCGNGQTYGYNSGEDIICPQCDGEGVI